MKQKQFNTKLNLHYRGVIFLFILNIFICEMAFTQNFLKGVETSFNRNKKILKAAIQKSCILDVDRISEGLPQKCKVYKKTEKFIMDKKQFKTFAKEHFGLTGKIYITSDVIMNIADDNYRFEYSPTRKSISFYSKREKRCFNKEINKLLSKDKYIDLAYKYLKKYNLNEPDMFVFNTTFLDFYGFTVTFYKKLDGYMVMGSDGIIVNLTFDGELDYIDMDWSEYEEICEVNLISPEIVFEKVKKNGGVLNFSAESEAPGNVRKVEVRQMVWDEGNWTGPCYLFYIENIKKCSYQTSKYIQAVKSAISIEDCNRIRKLLK